MSGASYSTDFPVTNGADVPGSITSLLPDAWVAGFSPDLTELLWASWLGGSGLDHGLAIATGPGGVVYVAGESDSRDIPGASGPGYGAGERDAVVFRIVPDLTSG